MEYIKQRKKCIVRLVIIEKKNKSVLKVFSIDNCIRIYSIYSAILDKKQLLFAKGQFNEWLLLYTKNYWRVESSHVYGKIYTIIVDEIFCAIQHPPYKIELSTL